MEWDEGQVWREGEGRKEGRKAAATGLFLWRKEEHRRKRRKKRELGCCSLLVCVVLCVCVWVHLGGPFLAAQMESERG